MLSPSSECKVNVMVGGGSPPFGMLFVVILVVVGIATWVILAASRFTQGGIVERP
jgi:hypothetical protein